MDKNPPDPSQPWTYPRRVLLAVTGLSPQVLTETLYALAVQRRPAFVPTEVHVISTAEGAERARLELLHRSTSHFRRLCRDYELGDILFDEQCIHTITGPDGAPLEDIQTEADNTRAADAITEVVRKFTEQADAALHVSIAGGRKTMGFYLGYALSLYGRTQDRLSHVLVNQPFEANPDFFFPPKQSQVLYTRENKPIHTSTATILLADIPFVRMRHGLPETLVAGQTTFSSVVAAAQKTLGPPNLVVNLDEQKLICGGVDVPLSHALLSWYAWMAKRRHAQDKNGNGGHIHWAEADHTEFLQIFMAISNESGDYYRAEQALRNGFDGKDFFLEKNARINRVLKATLGSAGAEPYLIGKSGKRPKSLWGLTLDPGAIRLIGY